MCSNKMTITSSVEAVGDSTDGVICTYSVLFKWFLVVVTLKF